MSEFIKKTWWLFLVLFLAPVIVIVVFAVLEFMLNRVDLSSGDWASLFGSAFGYWGTVILGTLAFWQNDRAQKNNDVLTQYERSKMSPVFSVSFLGTEGEFSKIKFGVANCTDNIACNSKLSKLSLYKLDHSGIVNQINEYDILNQEKNSFLGAKEIAEVAYNTPRVSIEADERLIFKISIFATDVVGISKETRVEIVINNALQCKYKYEVLDEKRTQTDACS